MKILYVAVHGHTGWGAEHWLAKAFEDKGVDVIRFDYRKWRKYRAPWFIIRARLRSLVRGHGPDVVLLQRAERMPPSVIDFATEIPVVFWSTEPLVRNSDAEPMLGSRNLDWVYVHTYSCVDFVNHRHAEHAEHVSVMHNASPKDVVREAPESTRRFAIFNRGISSRRAAWLDRIADLVEVISGHFGEQYFADLRDSSVSVNIHYGPESLDDFESGIFEGMSVGCAIVSERLNPRVIQDLGMHGAIIEVDTPEQMRAELERLRRDPDLVWSYRRKSLGAMAGNTWDSRADQFIAKFDELLGQSVTRRTEIPSRGPSR